MTYFYTHRSVPHSAPIRETSLQYIEINKRPTTGLFKMSNYRALSCKQDAFIKVLPSGLRDLKWKRKAERLLKTRVVDDCKESVSSMHNRTATHTAHRE